MVWWRSLVHIQVQSAWKKREQTEQEQGQLHVNAKINDINITKEDTRKTKHALQCGWLQEDLWTAYIKKKFMLHLHQHTIYIISMSDRN